MTEQLTHILSEIERICLRYPGEITAFRVEVIGQSGMSLGNYAYLAEQNPTDPASQKQIN